MTHGVSTPLKECCEMVRRGAVPGHEIARIVQKHRSHGSRAELRAKIMASARSAAEMVGNRAEKSRGWISIVGESGGQEDLSRALEAIGHLETGARSAMKALLVKTLLQKKRFQPANAIIVKIKNAFWRAEALLCLACATGLSSDFQRAREVAQNINDKAHRDHTLFDIEYAESSRLSNVELPGEADTCCEGEVLRQFVGALVSLNSNHCEAYEAALLVENPLGRLRILIALAASLSK